MKTEIERLTAAWRAEMELSAKFQQELAAARAAADKKQAEFEQMANVAGEAIRSRNSALEELAAALESVRTLLRDARRWSDSEWYLIVSTEAYEAARAAGGE